MIEITDRGERLPLSFAQQRLWFLAQMGEAGEAYHVPFSMHLQGEVDHDALRRTLDRIVARHEALRTTFVMAEGEAFQRIAPERDSCFHLVEHDLREQADADREGRRLAVEEVRAPFDLEAGPLIRGRLIRYGEQDCTLLITMHHIVSDGWSMEVFREELSVLYGAFVRGDADPLPALKIQYADYAVWQRKWIEGNILQRQADYWKKNLAEAPAVLDLPADHARPMQQDYAGGTVRLVLDEKLTAKLKALSRRHGTTLFMTLLGGWTALLARLSGQQDIVVGTPVANRSRSETEGLIGFFVNTLVLRVDLSGSPTVKQLLERVKEQTLEAQQHQDIPFEQVVEIVRPVRSLAHSPLFQVMFVWQPPRRGTFFPGMVLKSLRQAPHVVSKFDLTLSLVDVARKVMGQLEYATALFEQETIERYAGYFRVLLEAMVEDDSGTVDRLRVLPEAEREQVLYGWNRTEAEYPRDKCIQELFEEQVRKTPQAVAVVFEEATLSYGELNGRANRLAHYLRELGVKPDARVAICVERGFGMITALLAVLKAGGAYVPLDPAYPEERLRFMLEDSAPVALLTETHLKDLFAEFNETIPVIDLAREDGWRHCPDIDPDRAGQAPQHLAYVIYTSGSTGSPKGVMVEHQGLCNRIVWMQQAYDLSSADAVLQKTPFGFDVSVWEFFWPLVIGAKLVMARPEGHKDPAYLCEVIRESRITTIHFVPSMLQAFLEYGETAKCSTLTDLVCSGEALPAMLAQQLQDLLPSISLHNLYGPTEATVDVTSWTYPSGGRKYASIPIGRPIANTRIYILDSRGEPVPVGVAGELYIGGAGVARGYLNRPELTAERFLADPFMGGGQERMYRTGDLGRWLADGNIEFLGRNDFQVKIRGFRIELGEIEARLAECEGVREAVVVAREDTPGEKRLVAYYTGTIAGVEALRSYLSAKLPEYMVPAAYVQLESLPLTPNGKLDRKALPAPETEAYGTREYEPPADGIESTIAEIWSEVLGVDRVGRWDNFFDLGGHSLLAVRVIMRIQQALNRDVAITDLFVRPVLAELAGHLETVGGLELPPIAAADRGERLPLSFAQQRLWFLAQMGEAGEAYHVPFSMHLQGEVDHDALRRTLDRIVARHEALRTTFVMAEGEAFQRIAPERDSCFHLVEHDLREQADADREGRRLAVEEVRAPFDLEAGPLIRGRLIRYGEQDCTLLITMHHIVSDGWSMEVFREELSVLYGAFVRGDADPLPALKIQYADYAVWQRKWIEGNILQRQADYWKKNLAEAPAVLDLPADHARPMQQDYAGGTVRLVLDEKLTAKLKALSRRHGTTLFMTLLGGWTALLARLSGQQDIVVGTPVANRSRSETEGLIGFFVNTLVLRVDLSGSPTVKQLLERVKEQTLEAQQHQDIPFEQVVEIVRPVRSLAHSPLFQVMFVWQNASERRLVLPGVGIRPVQGAPHVMSKFDLTLVLREAGERIAGGLEYATALFEQETIERYAGYFRVLLEAMVEDDSGTVDRLQVLPEAEREQVLYGWNRTEAEYPRDKCIQELFEEQVRKTPQAVAVVFEEATLSYGELNGRANRLAHYLRELGVKPDARVAICVERGFGMITALLAVLKAGGAYVPLDPAYPEERLRFMLEDSAPVALLTETHLKDLFAKPGRALPVLELDGETAPWQQQPGTNPDTVSIGLTPQHLAYIIYTSGSTGTPKGVMIEHKNAVNLICWARSSFSRDVLAETLFSTSLNFDLAMYECFVPIVTGAIVRIVPNIISVANMQTGVTLINTVPSAMKTLIEINGVPGTVQIINLAGEVLNRSLAEHIFIATRVRTVCNLYAPSETTTYSTWVSMKRGEMFSAHIGRPIANTRIYILDSRGEPVPVGVAGELYIGGAGVARGYLNRPELTAERFLADPFMGGGQERMYRTGDLGRWLADGNIEFLGRNDFQVKIRGFRIELGEIEARLAECEGVREAVVVAREDTPGEKRLVAYYTGTIAGVEALRSYLSAKLPEYMVPAAYVQLESLPLTPNGKLDRKALPAPETEAYGTREYEPPADGIESTIAEIWSEVLGVDRVGRWDNFFDLGGHSLLAVRVIMRIQQALNRDVAITDLFVRPVLAELAGHLETVGGLELPPIAAADRGERLPLSFAQQRLWFLAQMGEAGEAYHVPFSMHLQGEVDHDALRRTLDRIVARHEALRTTFVMAEGEAFQRIAPERDSCFHLVEHDLREQADADREGRRLAVEEVRAPFDLEAGPLIRGRLIRYGEQDCTLLITMHHIVSDGWSMEVFREELSVLYGAFVRGDADPLPALKIQYADYAVWQRKWIEGNILQRQADYWKKNLAEAPAVLDLPADHARPMQQDYAGGTVRLVLDEKLTAKLKALSRRHGTTLFMTLLGGWTALLARLSGQQDIVVGTPVANRSRSETEGLIGFFVNTLVLRVDLSGSPTVKQLLERVKEQTLEAQQHQDIPFEQVVEIVRPVRSLAHSPLFQVMFVWQNASERRLVLPGVGIRPVQGAPHVMSKFDLTLVLREAGERIAGGLEYATALFEQETIERYAGYFRVLLEAMVEDDSGTVDRLQVLPEAEREQVLYGWNRTEAEYPRDKCIQELFEEQVRKTPQAVAVVFEEATLSYGELNGRANRLAHYLRELGVKPDARVAICVERGFGMITALLAVLKAGGAYVPLDPAYPEERLRFMLEDSAPVALLTETHLKDLFAEFNETIPVIDLAREDGWRHCPDIDPDRAGQTPQHLAYVIYTSGSTGSPKGVMVEHNAVKRLVLNNGYAKFDARDRVALSSNPAFDAATMEVWAPLLNGGCIVAIKQSDLLAPAQFGRVLRQQQVNILWLTVGLFNQYADVLAREFSTLRYLIVGGDALDPRIIAKTLNTNPPEHLLNGYGPTETTTFAITHEIIGVPEHVRSIPIGRPIANTRIYILDSRGEPVPVGVAGELYIGGAGVARGYLNRPELTAERFLADPFMGGGQERMYRTGDLGRWLADGNIEFLGRNDFQVKIRGFRIELGEIEARLAECEGVREAVVVAREDTPGEKRLVAYYTGTIAGVEALRSYLSAKLPEYMVPAAYVQLESLPLTPNGKLDRKALPAPETEAYGTREYEPPADGIESTIAEIWSEVLGVDRVGRWDNFFDLGGHSLLAVRVIMRIQQALNRDVAITDLFVRPVLAELAGHLETVGGLELPPIAAADRGERLPLSFAQQRLWFLAQMGEAGEAYHVPFSMHLQGEVDHDALRRTLDRIVARHEALRTTFVMAEGEAFQRIAPERDSCFHLVEHDLREQADADREGRRLAVEEVRAPFDLEAGPLIRGRLIRYGEQDCTLLITMHHIVSDGWSMEVFREELSVLYGAFVRGDADPLPALKIQYADYAVWQRKWIEGNILQRQADYWKKNLAEAPAVLDLPADHARPMQQDYAGGTVRLVLDEKLTAKLKALSRRHGTTLFMTLLGGWTALLARLSGQQDIVVGTPVANRSRSETEGLIGFFVNTLVLRVDLSGSPTVKQLLERVKEQTLEAQQHQDIPFEQVVEIVRPVRSLAHSPLFQVMFVWQNASERRLVLPGVGIRPVQGAPHVMSKFDLTLVLREAGERIAGGLEYATALFEQETIERYAGYFRVLLEAMVEDDSGTVDRLQVLPEAEREQVLYGWNRTEAEYPRDKCIQELFEEQVRKTPQAVAVVFEEATLSYGELNGRANRLAHYLRELGVKPDARVAICVERGFGMITALLAVLKAGGAYVPLDPAYPEERLRFMLEDSAPVALLTETHLKDLFAEFNETIPVIDLAREDGWRHCPDIDPDRAGQTPQHLAYVIYTSGSTGSPKGVMVEHQGLCNLTILHSKQVKVDSSSRILQFASFSFDGCVFEIVMAICQGASLYCAPKANTLLGQSLAGFVAQYRITHAILPPVVLATLPNNLRLDSIKTLITAGDKPTHFIVRRWATSCQLMNGYGPTEATVATTLYNCWTDHVMASIPIGRPIANTRIYILDSRGEPVPVGVAGELYIGGAGVARGYLNRPELTAERFLADPFMGGGQERMYRTGDLGRWLADGNIEFLGRNDFQVKIRGFRIELGEIEARLAECEGVREAVVVAREDTPGEKRLVAYYTGTIAGVEALRSYLSAKLPEYMVPAAYVQLESLPLTPNGKLDRKALPAPETEAYGTREYEPPADGIESTIAEIWSEVLGVDRVGRWDNFFDLGGHSLLAVRVIMRIQQALNRDVAITDLFVRPVLAELAGHLETVGGLELPPIAAADRGERLPLSFAQQRLWFLAQMGEAGEAYHVPFSMHLQGEVDHDALRRTLDRIVARHEALRTTFVMAEGEAFQRIAPERDSCFHLVEHDLREQADADREGRRLAVEEVRAPFDLEAGPLIRGRLIRYGEQDCTLLITMHHIVSDGWSMEVFREELSVLYGAFVRGDADPLPALKIQYADYAVWQRKWIEGNILQRQADYWKKNLAEAPAVLDLPADHARPMQQDYAGGTVRLVLDEKLTAKLKALSRRHGTTLFMTLLGGWTALLARLSGQQDIVVGTPVANRSRSETEGLIGFFVNTLVLRVDLSGSPTVKQLLERVKEQTLEAQQHQDIPFEQVVEIVRPVRSLAHSPLFQVMFVWQNASERRLVLPGVGIRPVQGAPHVMSKFDLTLVLREAGERIAGGLEYATALFEQETIERYAGYFRVLLEAMVEDDSGTVDRLQVLPEAEREQVLYGWNRTEAEYPRDKCIQELFEEQVRKTPQAVAVVFEEATLSYGELNGRANRLAHYLRELGVKPDARVAICVERGFGMITALLAVLKAGGAYVPLDPAYPEERLRFMLEDSAPVALLTETHLKDLFAEFNETIPVIDLAREDGWRHCPDIDPDRAGQTPQHLAYVIYTSGSTGSPKGVMVEHNAVTNFLLYMQKELNITSDDVLLAITTLAFDIAALELYLPLITGASVHLLSRKISIDGSLLLHELMQQNINVIQATPASWQMLLQAGWKGKYRLKLICGGDALSSDLANNLRTRSLFACNMYGPTETTIWSLIKKLDHVMASIPIGRPIANTRIYILDSRGEPVPVGVAGELYIGGAGVARGYLNRPELTAERFLADPFMGGGQERMYRTGDLGRWLADGNIEFLGRNDFQVKIRGFRIELGEIEARLAECEGVREAVVVAREDTPGEKRLVAYYTGTIAGVEALRSYLSAKLPEYMVPAAYVQLESLPLTPNGKLDRKALPAPETEAYGTREYEPPADGIESTIAEIWSEVLGVDRVGRWDNFFDLGGHSLLAVRVIMRIQQRNIYVDLQSLFRSATLADLAIQAKLQHISSNLKSTVRSTMDQEVEIRI